MKKIAFLIIIIVFWGCGVKQPKEDIWSSLSPVVKMQKTTHVKVIVNPEEIPPGESPESVLWSKALKQGMQKICNYWITKRFLFQAANKTLINLNKVRFLTKKGQFSAVQDPMTNVYTQEFRLQAEFLPIKQIAGRIVDFKANHTLAGFSDFVNISLFERIPSLKTAYFLVARKEAREQNNYLQVIGSGKIYNTVGKRAQGILSETAQEIVLDNVLFLLQVQVEPV